MIPERDFVLHSWCVPGDWNAPTVVGGRGATCSLEDGREILDMSSLVECSNLGHQHPKLVAAIKAQADKLAFVTAAWGAESRRALAERLLEVSGFEGGRVFFTLGGARRQRERRAHRAPGDEEGPRPRRHARPLVPRRELHGHGALGRRPHRAPGGRRSLGRAPRAAALRLPLPLGQRRPPTNAAGARPTRSADAIDKEGADRVAAVLMEVDAGSNGIVPPDNFWPALRTVTRERGVYLIADEVMSGFGRCGEWFAWQRYGEANRPDLMTLAKGLTGARRPARRRRA